MRRLTTTASLSIRQAGLQSSGCCCCNAALLAASASLRQQQRTYALSRYRDERHGGAANRFSRGRSSSPGSTSNINRNASSANQQKQPASESKDVVPSSSSSNLPPSEPPASNNASKGFWSSYDTYVPDGPISPRETALEPPPVAPGDLITLNDEAARILSEPSLVVVRQLEMMNVFLGFEQANRYRLVNAKGEDVGFLAEQEGGFGTSIGRQLLRGHRPFNCAIMDTAGNVVLRVTRPLSYVNSRISISKGSDPPSAANKIGECQQIWSPFRRKYALYHRYRADDPKTYPDANTSTKALTIQEGSEPEESYAQFANIDSRVLAWDFYLQSETGQVLGSVNRNFMGFGREIFTDTGQYVLRFDRKMADMEVQERMNKRVGINEELNKVAAENKEAKEHQQEDSESTALVLVDEHKGLTLDQRAVLLAAAVTIDIDYFSRSGGGMHMPMLWMPLPGMGGGAGAEVPPGAEGVPGGEIGDAGGAGTQQAPVGSSSSGADDAPFASPEYGESPGLSDSYGGDGGGGGFDPYSPTGSGEDTMQDPWAGSGSQSDGGGGDGEGGGFWGFIGDITDSFGGGDS